MVLQGVAEITLRSHFKALLSPPGSFTFYSEKTPGKRRGALPCAFIPESLGNFLVKRELLSRMFPHMQRFHLQGDVLSQMERLLAALGNRFQANGILVTPQVAQSPQLLTPTEINKDKN